ncbi:hypothetical protein HYT32_00440 [Candidatus Roizmanbacteria bacterium]|nr:hypothetical protein [Candidatus Roizmanbacteria bacterium]
MTKLNKSSGLTVIELLIVILLISSLGVMSVSFYARFLTQNAVDNTTTQLINSLRKAQIYSMTGRQNGSWGVRFTTSPRRITLYLVGSSDFDESFGVSSNTSINNFTDITFAKVTGIPSSSPTITIAGNNNSKSVAVNSQGVVSKTN